jgi:RIO kinase 1
VSFDLYHDEYEHLAARFQLNTDEDRLPRSGKPRKKTKGKQGKSNVATNLADAQPKLEDVFHTTYRPARYEAIFLKDSLQPFVTQVLIDDVLALVKGGKEANVYLCQAAPHLDVELIAAKVYRPRQFRNLRNDITYREGRELVSSLGIPIKNQDNREMRAIHKKTSFGAELTHISWLMHEHITLERLHKLGAAVPKPMAAGENAILMTYIGDRNRPAPALHGVSLSPREAAPLCDEVLRNVELMLAHGMVHGDLSAYNILYWEGKVTLIDFPQVTLSESNHNAYRIFQRDVRRVCEYFATQGVERDPDAIVRRLWSRYVRLAPDRTVQDGV